MVSMVTERMVTDSATHDPWPDWTRRLAASDQSALQAVFDELHDGLVLFARRMLGDHTAALDAVQVAFIRLWEHRAELDATRSVRAWLFRTVRNLALTSLRDARNQARHLDGWDEAPVWRAPDPDVLLQESELGQRLARWLAELPERQREAIVLSRFDGLSHEEVAAVMQISPRTVNNHIVRGVQALRERFDAERMSEQA